MIVAFSIRSCTIIFYACIVISDGVRYTLLEYRSCARRLTRRKSFLIFALCYLLGFLQVIYKICTNADVDAWWNLIFAVLFHVSILEAKVLFRIKKKIKRLYILDLLKNTQGVYELNAK